MTATVLDSGNSIPPVLLDSDDVLTEDDDALIDDEVLELDTLLPLELDGLDAVLTLLTVLQLELDKLEMPNSSSFSIPRGSVSIVLMSWLVFKTLVNCPLCL